MVETGNIIESIYYLLKNLGKADKIKLVKLLYFADKYHLIKYGRTITNDDYWAMGYGPVGSNVKDVLEYDTNFTISDNEHTYAEKYFSKIGVNHFKIITSKETPKFKYLSETDIEALDYVIERFGSMESWNIADLSHEYPEWLQYKELFKKNEIRRERIQTEELISTIPNDPLEFTPEDIELARNIYSGVV